MKIISINKIQIRDGKLCHEIHINGHDYSVWTELSNNVLDYVITDRIDSIVLGLLLFSVRNGYDFVSELPITDSLLYNIQNHFINALVGNTNLHKVVIKCPTCPELKRKGSIVSTGVSCGVDSLYTILQHYYGNVPEQKRLTHLTFMNIGSHHNEQGLSEKIFEERRQHILQYSKLVNLPVIEIKSNLPDIINEIDPNKYSHLSYHSFMALFAILNISSGVSNYYYSSGYSYRDFSCVYPDEGEFDSALFDLLTMNVASYGSTHFSSFGGDVSRIDKVAYLSQFPEDASYLSVCIHSANNCGKCFKCRRTLLEIDTLGKCEVFSKAFDMNEYVKIKNKMIEWLYIQHLKGDPYAEELMPYYEFSFLFKLKTITHKLCSVFNNKFFRKK